MIKRVLTKFFKGIKCHKNSIIVFKYQQPLHQTNQTENKFVIISNEGDFNKFRERYRSYSGSNFLPGRFEKGDFFYALIDECGYCCSSGWSASSRTFFVSEINQSIEISKNSVVLYDFYTEESKRGLGMYPRLLKEIVSNNYSFVYFIYILKGNTSSERGILKAGFVELQTISFYNRKKMINIFNNLESNITCAQVCE